MFVPQLGYTPLMSAADRGHYDVVKDLLALGADVNVQNNVSDISQRSCHSLISFRIFQLLYNIRHVGFCMWSLFLDNRDNYKD